MTSYTKKAIRGTTITFIGIVIAAFFTYITRIILARALTPSEYGLFFAVFVFLTFFELFRDFGLNSALVKYIAEFNVKKKQSLIKSSLISVFFIQLFGSIAIVTVLFLLSDYLAVNYFTSPSASFILRVLSLFLVFNIFDDILRKIVHGYHKMHMLALIELSRNFSVLVFVIIFLKFNLRALAPTYSYVISPVLVALIFAPIIIRRFSFFKEKFKLQKKLIKKLFVFGVPSIFATFSEKIIAYADVLILTFFISISSIVTLDKIGAYNVVLPTAMLLLYFARAISLVLMPLSSELWAKKEYSKLSDGLSRLHKYSLLIVIPAALTLISFSRLYIGVFFGKEYAAGTVALQIILVGVIFFTLAKINNTVIQNIGKPKIVAKIVGLAAILNIIINIILIPIYGIAGAAIATSLTYIFAWVFSNHYAKKLMNAKVPWADLLKLFIAGIAFVAVIFYVKKILMVNVYLEFLITVGIASAVYLLIVFLLKAVTIKEIKGLIRLAIKK